MSLCQQFLLVFVFLAPLSNCDKTNGTSKIVQAPKDSRTLQVNPETRASSQPNFSTDEIQKWFEELSKNTSTASQNTFNSLKDFFAKLAAPNGNSGNSLGAENYPVMILGSFQALKIPLGGMGSGLLPNLNFPPPNLGNLANLGGGAGQALGQITG